MPEPWGNRCGTGVPGTSNGPAKERIPSALQIPVTPGQPRRGALDYTGEDSCGTKTASTQTDPDASGGDHPGHRGAAGAGAAVAAAPSDLRPAAASSTVAGPDRAAE